MQGQENRDTKAENSKDEAEGNPSRLEGGAKPHSFEWLGQIGNLIAGLATAGALIFTAISVHATQEQVNITRDQATTAQQGQLTDRFTKAVEQLGSDKLEVRTGGVYALQRIARDSPRDKPAVIDVLTAFVREQPPASRSITPPYSGLSSDLQAAVTAIVRQRDVQHESTKNYLLTLEDAPLGGAMLRYANLSNVDFRNADFRSADLQGADVSSSYLSYANLAYAILRDSYLSGADLEGVNLQGADLRNADLRNANLRNANLRNAILDGADLGGANREGTIGLPPP